MLLWRRYYPGRAAFRAAERSPELRRLDESARCDRPRQLRLVRPEQEAGVPAGVKDVSVLNLWKRYAAQDFRLTETQLQENVQMMLAADRVVLQFPIHWYNVPW